MNDNISDKDKKDWQSFVLSKDKLPNKDFKPRKKNILKVRSIDLHGYTLEHANNVIEEFILKAYEEKMGKLIVVTGKGTHSDVERDPYVSKDLSILKYFPEFINNNQNLMRVINDIQMPVEDGGVVHFIYFKKKNYDYLVILISKKWNMGRSFLSSLIYTENGSKF